MPVLTVEVKGFNELARRLDRMGLRGRRRLRTVINSCALRLQTNARRKCVVDTGRLRASIRAYFYRDGLVAEVGTEVAYAPYVEFGSGPHRSAIGSDEFVKGITRWAKRVLGLEADEVFPLIRHIRENGTKPHPFLAPAWEEMKSDCEAKITAAIKSEWGRA